MKIVMARRGTMGAHVWQRIVECYALLIFNFQLNLYPHIVLS